MEQSKKIVSVTLIITIFVLAVSLTALYVQAQIEAGTVCTCAIPIPVLMPILSSIGLLVGTLVYYFFVPSPEGRSGKNDTGMISDMVGGDEGVVLRKVIEEGGNIPQSRIVSSTGLSKVRVFRAIEKLRKRNLVSKSPHGKTNMIEARKDMLDAFG